MCKKDDTAGERLHRRGRLGLYDEPKRLLIAILDRNSGPPSAGAEPGVADIDAVANTILLLVDGAWRLAERIASYNSHVRQDASWKQYRDALAAGEHRARIVFRRFDQRRRNLGAPAAARTAARGWAAPLPYAARRARTNPAPSILWEARVVDALIETLEQAFRRRLRLGGPDIQLLVALFSIILADRRRRGLPVELRRGKGARRPGTASWFIHRLRYRRQSPGFGS